MESKPPAANEPEKKGDVEITKAVKMQSRASLPDDMALESVSILASEILGNM